MDHARRRRRSRRGPTASTSRSRRRGSTIAGGRREGPAPRAWRIRTPSSRPPTRPSPRLPADECAGLTLGRFIDALDAPGDGRDAVRMRLQGTNAIDLGRVALRVVGGADGFAAPSATYRRMTRGNQSLPDAMAELVARRASRTSDPVRHARPRRGRGPTWRGTSTSARPPSSLALPARVAAGMRFEPRLPDDLGNALRELPMGSASKLAVAVDGSPEPRRGAERGAAVLVLGGERRRRRRAAVHRRRSPDPSSRRCRSGRPQGTRVRGSNACRR